MDSELKTICEILNSWVPRPNYYHTPPKRSLNPRASFPPLIYFCFLFFVIYVRNRWCFRVLFPTSPLSGSITKFYVSALSRIIKALGIKIYYLYFSFIDGSPTLENSHKYLRIVIYGKICIFCVFILDISNKIRDGNSPSITYFKYITRKCQKSRK